MQEPKPGLTRDSWWLYPADEPLRRGYGRQTLAFLAITFAITYGVGVLAFLFPNAMIGENGLSGPRAQAFFFLAVYGPTLAGLILIVSHHGWRRGLADVFAGVIAPRTPLTWVIWAVIALAVMPLGWLMVDALAHIGLGGGPVGPLEVAAIATVPVLFVTTLALIADPGPIGEEYGWRGYLLPRLIVLLGPLRASILIGIIWGIWHLPVFFFPGTNQASASYAFMMANWIGSSILMTWIFIRTGGNWFLSGVIVHASLNTSLAIGILGIDPLYALGSLFLASAVLLWRGPDLDLALMRDRAGPAPSDGT